MRTVEVEVPLGERSYSILIGNGLLTNLGNACSDLHLGNRCVILADENVVAPYLSVVKASLSRSGFAVLDLIIPSGETAKSLSTVSWCYDRLAEHRMERKSWILALGGGVTGDLAGFVAATYLRGIPFVQVPTTLLAQVDSSVGGKVGVNLEAGKNLVGAFHQPRLVVCDLDTFDTLPAREFRGGLAEVIKYGIIRDADLFQQLENQINAVLEREPEQLARIVARCCEIKAEVVSQDEREGGIRAILNFGHTIGHAIEAVSGYGQYLHGEAISIGQVAAAKLSQHMAGLASEETRRIETLFANSGLPTLFTFSPEELECLRKAMELDKKVSGGEVRFVLAETIGKATWGWKVPWERIRSVLQNPKSN